MLKYFSPWFVVTLDCLVLTIKLNIVRMKIQTEGDLSDPATNAKILQQVCPMLFLFRGEELHQT